MKRSEAKKLGQENNCFTNDSRIDYFLDILVECGLEFEPEELSAVEKWNNWRQYLITKNALPGTIEVVDSMHDELQAEIERLKAKKPYVESLQLKNSRDNYYKADESIGVYEALEKAHTYISQLERALKELTA